MKNNDKNSFEIINKKKLDGLCITYNEYKKCNDDMMDHIARSVLSGIAGIALSLPIINIFKNQNVINDNIIKFALFNLIAPTGLFAYMISNIKKAKSDNIEANNKLNIIDRRRGDISYEYIDQCSNQDIEDEMSDMFSKNDTKLVKKIKRLTFYDRWKE